MFQHGKAARQIPAVCEECCERFGRSADCTAQSMANPYIERLIGSTRRECLDHLIVFREAHLRRAVASYVRCYHGTRTHLAFEKEAPYGRAIQPVGRT